MGSKPRLWPNVAANARDRAAEEAGRALNALEPLIFRDVADVERLRRMAIAVNSLQLIARHLEGVGAQTRPE